MGIGYSHVPEGKPSKKPTQARLKKSFKLDARVTNATLFSVLTSENTGYAVGQSGVIVSRRIKNWQLHPDSGVVARDLIDIGFRFAPPDDAVIVGGNGAILQAEPPQDPFYSISEDPDSQSFTTESLRTAEWGSSLGFGINVDRLVMMGDNGKVITADGDGWGSLSAFEDNSFSDNLKISDSVYQPLHGLFITKEDGSLLKSPVGSGLGKQWETKIEGGEDSPFSGAFLGDVRMAFADVNPTRIWIAPRHGDYIYLYNEGTESLDRFKSPIGGDQNDIVAINIDTAFVIGQAGTVGQYDGEDWVRLKSPAQAGLAAGYAQSINDLGFVGSNGTIIDYFGDTLPSQTVDSSGRVVSRTKTPIASVTNVSPGASTDILSTDLSPGRSTTYRIKINLGGESAFKAVKTRNGNTYDNYFNQTNTLTPNAGYTFDLQVRSDDTVNFQIDSAVTVNELDVDIVETASA